MLTKKPAGEAHNSMFMCDRPISTSQEDAKELAATGTAFELFAGMF